VGDPENEVPDPGVLAGPANSDEVLGGAVTDDPA
jgi:hypothetical protein